MGGPITPSRRVVLGAAAGWAGVGLLPARAFAAASRLSPPLPDPIRLGALVYDVRPADYVAEEYFLSGRADVYAPVTMADAPDMASRDNVADLGRRRFDLPVKTPAAPYTTRIVIYRPRDPARFSGNVVVEANHPGGGGALTVWGPLNDVFTSNGDIHLSVQHPITFVSLKAASPARYAPLSAVDYTQIWGMLRDAGAVARSRGADAPLRGYAVRRLYMTGYSYTGVATATFANFHHDQARQPDGQPIYDGYLPMANATYVRPLDVPVLRMNTQSDFDSFGGVNNRGRDSDAPIGRYRLYEVPGAAHIRTERHWPGLLAPPAPLQPFVSPPGVPTGGGMGACTAAFPAGSHGNDFPLHSYAAAAFSNLYAWVDHGRPPPPGALIELGADGRAAMDRFGNARGGLRSCELEVPTSSYGVGQTMQCALTGYTLPFTQTRLRSLYGDGGGYLRQVRSQTERLLAQRLVRPREAGFIVSDAEAFAPSI